MLKSAIRLLPGVVATMLLLQGACKAADAVQSNWEESGQASWYGKGFNGHRTSSGAVYDQNAMTAAHPELPLGSRVRVTMQGTGNSVVVTITDRQPFRGYRIIDLSREAAARLGMLGSGTAMVTLTPAKPEDVEVAEATDDDDVAAEMLPSPRRYGRRHTRHANPRASAAHAWSHAPSVILARHSAPLRATRHTL